MRILESRKKKGQFFLITTILITITLFSVSSLLDSYSKRDLKDVSEPQEPSMYYNIRSQVKENLKERGSTPTLQEKEMNRFIEDSLLKMGFRVNINSSTCVNITFKSDKYSIKDKICP